MSDLGAEGDARHDVAGERQVDAAVGAGTGDPGKTRGGVNLAAEPYVVVVVEVERVVVCDPVEEVGGVVVVGAVTFDGDVPGLVRDR